MNSEEQITARPTAPLLQMRPRDGTRVATFRRPHAAPDPPRTSSKTPVASGQPLARRALKCRAIAADHRTPGAAARLVAHRRRTPTLRPRGTTPTRSSTPTSTRRPGRRWRTSRRATRPASIYRCGYSSAPTTQLAVSLTSTRQTGGQCCMADRGRRVAACGSCGPHQPGWTPRSGRPTPRLRLRSRPIAPSSGAAVQFGDCSDLRSVPGINPICFTDTAPGSPLDAVRRGRSSESGGRQTGKEAQNLVELDDGNRSC